MYMLKVAIYLYYCLTRVKEPEMPFQVEIHAPSINWAVSNLHYLNRSVEFDYGFAFDMTYGTTLFPFSQMNQQLFQFHLLEMANLSHAKHFCIYYSVSGLCFVQMSYLFTHVENNFNFELCLGIKTYSFPSHWAFPSPNPCPSLPILLHSLDQTNFGISCQISQKINLQVWIETLNLQVT